MTTNRFLMAEADAPAAAAPRKLLSSATGAVEILEGEQRRLEIRYYDAPEKSRRWSLSREDAQDLVRWWVERGCTQTPRGGFFPEQGFGRIFVSPISHTQVYFRGSDALGRPNITGYQFPLAVVETLASYLPRSS